MSAFYFTRRETRSSNAFEFYVGHLTFLDGPSIVGLKRSAFNSSMPVGVDHVISYPAVGAALLAVDCVRRTHRLSVPLRLSRGQQSHGNVRIALHFGF